MLNKINRGFTLIELLVVIAIVGVMSSIVLAQLNTARNKAADAAVKSNLSSMRTYAESIYDDPALSPNGYNTVCNAPKMLQLKTAAEQASGGSGTCSPAVSSWRTWVPLKTAGRVWCVDSAGGSREVATPSAGTVCPVF